jgi:hypothetical protein
MKDKFEIVYSINIQDIQTVAFQEMDRELTDGEIEKVKDIIGERLNWYDAILDAINERINV